MTSFRQIEANRRNAYKSTGPITEEGKQRSRCNAVRHGLTAETVIGALEDAEDYKAFEAAIIADYDAQSAVERELVLRLASLLWRLRRATAIETGLFELEADNASLDALSRAKSQRSHTIVRGLLARARSRALAGELPSAELPPIPNDPSAEMTRSAEIVPASTREFGRCFLGVTNLPDFAFDRLN